MTSTQISAPTARLRRKTARGDILNRLLRIYLMGTRRTRASSSGVQFLAVDARFLHAFQGCDATGREGERLWGDLSKAFNAQMPSIAVSKERMQFMLVWLRRSVQTCMTFIEEDGVAAQIEPSRQRGAHKACASSEVWAEDVVVEYLVLQDLLLAVQAALAAAPSTDVLRARPTLTTVQASRSEESKGCASGALTL